jgi:hypothetical protein
MPDVEHFNPLLLFEDSVDHPINVTLAAIQEMPKVGAFSRNRAAIGHLFQAENSCCQSAKPPQSRIGLGGADFLK